MKPEHVYERSQSAGRMEVAMTIAGFIGITAAIFALIHGWLPSLILLLLGLIAFALARVVELLADVLAIAGRLEEIKKPSRAEKDQPAVP